MRTLLRATFDVVASNQAIVDGRLPKIMKSISDRIKPEATYFLTNEGCRSCLMVFDLKDASDIPQIAETFFLNLNAKVEFSPVMNPEDLEKGLIKWEKNAKLVPEHLAHPYAN